MLPSDSLVLLVDWLVTVWFASAVVQLGALGLEEPVGWRGLAKVPVYGVEQLHGLLVGPDGVDDEGEQGQAREEEDALGQGHVGVELLPVRGAHVAHVVGEHHAAVEHVDHHPLVGPPEEGLCPAGLETLDTDKGQVRERERERERTGDRFRGRETDRESERLTK